MDKQKKIDFFEKYLTIWVSLCILIGIILGYLFETPFTKMSNWNIGSVNIPVAIAIALFGLNSGASLATVVGILIEVPVMLSLVKIANKWKY